MSTRFSGTHVELTKDPEGAYSQLVRLQEGAHETEDTRAFNSGSKRHRSFDLDRISIARSGSHRLSLRKSLSRGSSGSSQAYIYNFGIPSPMHIPDAKKDEVDSIRNEVNPENKPKGPLRRLAYLNKPEIPALLLGTVAAAIHGVILPVFSLLLSSSIAMFFKPPHQLRKESRSRALLFFGLGLVAFVASPIQSFFLGVVGARLIKRIRSLTFEKVVHQEISWFDDPANSRYLLLKF